VYVPLDALYTTVVVYTYTPEDEHATDVRDDDVEDTDTVVQLTPPSVETYTVDVGLVTVTYMLVADEDVATDVKPDMLEELDTTEDQLSPAVGATVGTGVGLPGK